MKTHKIISNRAVNTENAIGIREALNGLIDDMVADSVEHGTTINWDTLNIDSQSDWSNSSFGARVTHDRRRVSVTLEVEASR